MAAASLRRPFLLAAVAYLAAGAALFALLRPDPLLFSRTLLPSTATQSTTDDGHPTN